MENLILSFNLVAPIFLLMAIGWLLVNRTKLADEALMAKLNTLVFQLFLPCMLFRNVYQVDLREEFSGTVVLFAAGSLLLLVAILWVVVPRVVKNPRQQGVVIQGIFRSNYVIFGVTVVTNLYGAEHAAMASLLSAVLVPMYNLLAVIVLTVFGDGKALSIRGMLWKIAKNPLILATLAGIVVALSGISFPSFVDDTLADLAGLATPLAFLVLGGQFDCSKIRGNLKITLPVLAVKLVVLPVLTIPVMVCLGYRGSDLLSLVLAYQTPVAVSSYIMAEQAGADGQLAGQLVVFSSAVCLVTLFVTIFILKQLAFL